MDIRFYEVEARSALNRVPERSRVPFPWTINPYRGCSHACSYCFARPTHTYLGFDAERDFEREIVVKVNAPELLRAELRKPSWKREHVALGTNTDPYQWVEGRYKLMPGIWEALRDARNPCSVLTKSPLLLRDIELFRELVQVTSFTACLSIPTLDEKAWRDTEPHTPNPKARLEAVRKLNDAGIPTGVLVAPLMPGINDAPEQVDRLLQGAADAGAVSIGGQGLFLRGETRDVFFDWLRESRPDLVERYEGLYRRGAYLPEAEGKRLKDMVRGCCSRWREHPRGTPARTSPSGLPLRSTDGSGRRTGARAGSRRGTRRHGPAGRAFRRSPRCSEASGTEVSHPACPGTSTTAAATEGGRSARATAPVQPAEPRAGARQDVPDALARLGAGGPRASAERPGGQARAPGRDPDPPAAGGGDLRLLAARPAVRGRNRNRGARRHGRGAPHPRLGVRPRRGPRGGTDVLSPDGPRDVGHRRVPHPPALHRGDAPRRPARRGPAARDRRPGRHRRRGRHRPRRPADARQRVRRPRAPERPAVSRRRARAVPVGRPGGPDRGRRLLARPALRDALERRGPDHAPEFGGAELGGHPAPRARRREHARPAPARHEAEPAAARARGRAHRADPRRPAHRARGVRWRRGDRPHPRDPREADRRPRPRRRGARGGGQGRDRPGDGQAAAAERKRWQRPARAVSGADGPAAERRPQRLSRWASANLSAMTPAPSLRPTAFVRPGATLARAPLSLSGSGATSTSPRLRSIALSTAAATSAEVLSLT